MNNTLKRHWLWFRLAMVFLTRLPVPIKQQVDDDDLNYATGYFAVVGVILALLFCLVFWLCQLLLPVPVSVAIVMAFGLVVTGAFHEDGLADTFDGLGGGWDVETKLNIMKDSRLGTYGASALFFSLLIKYQLLVSIAEVNLNSFFLALLLGHSVSRATAVSIMSSLQYVQLDAQSKTKPVAKTLQPISRNLLGLTAAVIFSLCFTLTLLSLSQILILSLILLAVRWLFITFIRSQLGGYTGDVLGAAQQVFEISIYLVLVSFIVGLGHG